MSTVNLGNNITRTSLAFNLDPTVSAGFIKTPRQLTGCIAWFDGSDTSTMSLSSNIVSSWSDKSVNNYILNSAQLSALPAGNFSPLYVANAINGLGAVYFDGSNDYMFVNSGMGLASAVAYTSFVVLSPRYFNTAQVAIGLQATSGTWEFFAYWAGLDDFRAGFDAGAVLVQTTSRNDNRPFINSTVRNGTSANAYINGFQYATNTTVASTVNSGVARLGIGANTYANGSVPYKGYICEIIIYNRALSDTERYQIQNYLSNKWRIPLQQKTSTNVDLINRKLLTVGSNNVPVIDKCYRLNPADALGSPKSSNFFLTDPTTYFSNLISTTITMEAWVKPNSFSFAGTNTDLGAIMICGGNFYLSLDGNGKFNAFMYGSNASTVSHQPSTTSVTRHAWNHVAWTYDGAYIRWYLNGVLDKTSSSTFTIGSISVGSYLGIGAESNSTYGRMLDGYVSGCKIYGKALSDSEILQNYEQTKTEFSNLPNIVTSGLQLYLDADVYSSYIGSGTTWSDLSGNAYNGTLTNGPTFSSTEPKCITFDGTNDYSLTTFSNSSNFINNPTTNSGLISFSIWVNVLSNTVGGYILSSGAQTSSTGMQIAYQNGSPEMYIKTTTKSWGQGISVSDFPLNTWINWTATCDNTNMYIYKNGSLYSTTASSAVSVSSQFSTLSIGAPNNVLNNYLGNFKLANVMFYNRTLSAAEVLQNYNATKFRFGL